MTPYRSALPSCLPVAAAGLMRLGAAQSWRGDRVNLPCRLKCQQGDDARFVFKGRIKIKKRENIKDTRTGKVFDFLAADWLLKPKAFRAFPSFWQALKVPPVLLLLYHIFSWFFSLLHRSAWLMQNRRKLLLPPNKTSRNEFVWTMVPSFHFHLFACSFSLTRSLKLNELINSAEKTSCLVKTPR